MNKNILLLFLVLFGLQSISQTTLFSENFESTSEGTITTGGFNGWKVYNQVNGTNTWDISDNCAYGGTYSMTVGSASSYCDYTASSTDKYAYYGTLIDATAYNSVTVDFDWSCFGEVIGSTYYDYGQVGYSSDGTTFTWLSTKYADETSTTYNVTNLDLSAVDGTQFYLAFRWENDGSGNYPDGFNIDNIVVKGTATCSVTAGTAAGATSICTGSTANLTISGQDGAATLQWEESTDDATWSNVSGGSGATTTSYTTASLTANKYYRCAVTNGCTVYTNSQLITVSPTSVAGTATTSDASVCNTATPVLTLTGSTGSIQWEESDDNATWANETGGTGGTTSSYTTEALPSTKYYRAKVTSGACATVYSNTITETVTTCVNMPAGTNSTTDCNGNLYDSGGSGGDYSDGENRTYTINPSATVTLTVSSFSTESTYDFFKVYDGTSASDPLLGSYSGGSIPAGSPFVSTGGALTIVFTSDGSNTAAGWESSWSCCAIASGTAAGATSICTGTTANLTISGQDGGATLQWQESTDNVTWSNVSGGSGATTSSYTTATLTANKYYRCAVTNGCTVSSNSQLITIDPASVAGTPSGSADLCADATVNLTLSGYTGTIQWEESTDGSSWANETGGTGGTTDAYTTETLTSDRYYRAAVTNGTCVVDYSSTLTITHNSKPTVQASSISFSPVTGNSMTVNWTRGNGAKVLVIAKEGSAPTDPTDGTAYSANSVYSSGDAVGGGYAVYNGTGTSVNVTGLTGNTAYHFAVYEFNGACYHLTELTGSQTTYFAVPYCESWNGSTGIWTASSATNYPLTYATAGTPSSNTGPTAPQDGSHYVFVESSSTTTGEISYLTTSNLNLTPYTDLQANFYYHMYGANTGDLSFEVSTDGGSTYTSVWSQSGELQTSSAEAWAHATVDLTAYAGNSTVLLRFKFSENGTITGDISIDNFCMCSTDFGTAAGDASVCGSGTTVCTLSGQGGGTTLQWQESTNGYSSWTNVTGGSGATTTSYTTASKSSTTYYRCVVNNGSCDSYSNTVTLTVGTAPVGGTATVSSTTVCKTQSVNLSLSGHTGTIQWEVSTDGGTTWGDVTGATTSAESVTISESSQKYRAELTSGSCSAVYSTIVTVTGQDCMTNTTNTDCSFTLYDSGGSGSNYSSNEELKYVICPDDPATERVIVTFDNFVSEADADIMRVYDGNDINFCRLNKFSGNHGTSLSGSPMYASQSNNSGCLTLFWNSDGSTTYSGWDVTVSCQPLASAPTSYDCPPPCDVNENKAGEDCESAPLVSSLNGYCGSTWDSSSPDPSGQNVPGGTNDYYTSTDTPSDYGGNDAGISWENSSFLNFIASATTVTIDYWIEEEPYSLGSCDDAGIQLRLHESTGECTGWNQTGEPSSGDWTVNPTNYHTSANPSGQAVGVGKQTWTISGLTIGNTYYLSLDGYAGRTCKYTFQAAAGIATCNISVDANREVCNGDGTYNVEIDYSGGAGAGFTYYVDDLDNGGATNSGDDPNLVASGTIVMGPYFNNSPYNVNLSGGNQAAERCDLIVQGQTNGCALTVCADADNADADGSVTCGTSFNLSYTTTATTVYTIDQTDCTPTLYPHTTGTAISLSDDQVTSNLNIGFSFDFFGTTYTQFRVHSNGILSFGGETYTGYTSQTIPTSDVDNFIAGCYRDLDPRATGSSISYETIGTAPNRKLIVTFDNMGLYSYITSTVSFQMVLEETTNCVKIHTINYPDVTDSWSLNEATQGIQSGLNTFIPPGRNWEEWGGITSTDNDCVTLCPVTTGGCTFDHWEDDLGNNVGTANPQSVTPGWTTTYYAVFDCSGTDCYQPQTVTVTGTCACDLKDYVYAPDGGTTVASSECTDAGGWTHYYNPSSPNDLLFSIYKNGNDLTGTTVQIDVENGGTDYLSESDTDYSTFLLRRAWRVLAAGPDYNAGTGALTNPVKVRFYYRASEKSDVEAGANAMTTSGGGSHDEYEAFVWFKSNDGVAYSHDNSAFTPSDITNAYELTSATITTTNTQNQTNYVQFDNVVGFSGGSGFAGSQPAVPLPIKLVQFVGEQKETTNLLKWRTASEINVSHFVVQKSNNPDKGFTDLTKVTAAGNSSFLQDYEIMDNNPFQLTYYRLKSVDFDGTFEFSNTIAMNRKIIKGEVNLYPNPAKEYLNIDLEIFRNGEFIVRLTDPIGKVVIDDSYLLESGLNKLQLNLSKLSKGVYYVTIDSGEEKIVEKVIVK